MERLRIPHHLLEEVCWRLKTDRHLEVLEQIGPLQYRYAVTNLGREQAAQLREISGYVGPLPVSIDDYTRCLKQQVENQSDNFSLEDVHDALRFLVLPEDVLEVAALAVSSRRGMFVFGPPGNGKTSLGHALHALYQGPLWIPYCICVEHNIIRIYDEHIHKPYPEPPPSSDTEGAQGNSTKRPRDARWTCIQRPFVVSGGEMTMDELDLSFSPSLRYYEAPPHVKANGGTFLIDDFGRQRIEPHELLNRWIIPLEHRMDHLSLVTGQKVQLPFELMLIVATNLQVSNIADPAFLRRMGYRLHVATPTREHYSEIFEMYARRHNIELADGIIAEVLKRYDDEGRELRGSEPRDLLERGRDVCQLRRTQLRFDASVLESAWRGYFGGTD